MKKSTPPEKEFNKQKFSNNSVLWYTKFLILTMSSILFIELVWIYGYFTKPPLILTFLYMLVIAEIGAIIRKLIKEFFLLVSKPNKE